MSVGQRALWFEQQADPRSNAYNLGICLRFAKPIPLDFLNRALRRAGMRHPLLRARFDLVDGEACWWVPAQPLSCTALPDGDLPGDGAPGRAEQFLLRPYDLVREPLIRLGLQALGDGCLVAIGCHHIVADLHSFGEFIRALDDQADASTPVAQGAGYAEFARSQGEFAGSDAGAHAAAFWRRQLLAVPSQHGLGDLESGVPIPACPAGRIDFTMAEEDARAVHAIADSCGTSAFVFLLTTFQALLARHAGRETVVVGTPYSGRRDPRWRRTLGYFVNLLPMVFRVDPCEPFSQALRRNATAVRGSLRRGRLPFPRIVEASTLPASELMEATLAFQKTAQGLDTDLTRLALGLPGGRLSLAGQVGNLVRLAEPRAQFPIGMAVAPVGAGFSGFLQFEPARVSQATANEFLQEWLSLVRACGERPESPVGHLLAQVAPRPFGGSASTLLEALEEAFATHAANPALCAGRGRLTYRDLDIRSRAIAAALRASGIGAGDRVAVAGDGGAGTVVQIIGVLRSGAAFVPMDATAAADQLRDLRQAAGVAATLGPQDEAPSAAADFIPARVQPADPAWLMFTSGTTGVPKAAVVPQAAALAHARGIAARFALGPADSVLQFASLSFDEHAEEIFPTLLAGGRIVFEPGIRYEDPARLLEFVRSHGVTVLHLPTSYWHLWCDELDGIPQPIPESLRLVNAGGEQASLPRLRRWAQRVPDAVRWFNSYGLTEASVTSLVHELDRSRLDGLDAVPAGLPLPGTRVRIVDEDGRDVPAGATGELLLGGAGLGSGYFEAQAATDARFTSARGARWLRTGDLARVAQEQVVIVGRRDRAVKLHGARIDLSAAEAVLGGDPAVLECALTLDADGDGLQAHVVLRPGRALSAGQVQSLIRALAPGVALPLSVRFMEELPRTAGRKPDYAALAKPASASQPASPPQPGPGEEAVDAVVRALFLRLLQLPHIDPAASFFTVGGHSLLAMRAVAALRRELGVEFSIADFLAGPSVLGVSAICRARNARPQPVLVPDPPAPGPSYPLSRAQRRLLTMAQMGLTAVMRTGWMLEISGVVDPARLAIAWSAVLQSHRLLTAAIGDSGNRECPPAGDLLRIPRVVLDIPDGASRKQRLAAIRKRQAPCASDGHLAAATLFQLSATRCVLSIEVRLLAVDGDSIPLLLQAFLSAYGGEGPRPAPAPYARFVQEEEAWLASPASQGARAWWGQRLQSSPAPTRLAGMRPATAISSRRLRCMLAPDVGHLVFEQAAAQGCSPFAVLLSAFLALLARWTGSDDLLIGVPVSLRDRLGVGAVCGPTLNPVPFRARPESADSFAELVRRTHADLAATLEHSPLPYEEIAAACDALRGAAVPIQFVRQEALPTATAHGLRIEGELAEREGGNPVGLLAGVRIGAAGIGIEFEYCPEMLADGDAAALLRSFRRLLAQLCADPDGAMGAARMLPWTQVRRELAVQPSRAACDAPAWLPAGIRQGAADHPLRCAVRCGPGRLSYAELDAWTDWQAQQLNQAGVLPGDRVAVVSRIGLEEVIAACSVLKAGAVYVPLPHEMPADRAVNLANHAQARVVTGDPELKPAWAGTEPFQFVPVSRPRPGLPPAPSPVPAGAQPGALAYILFTSGSTGTPKGVAVTHRAAMTTVNEMLGRFGVGTGAVLYRQAALDFDLSVFDIFGAFTAGATLVVPHRARPADAFAWADDVRRHGVTVWNSVPSALDMLLEAAAEGGLPSLRHFFCSGDWIALSLPARAQAASPGAAFIALGGATEASIWSNFQRVEAVEPGWTSIPYGRALGGQSMFVADGHGWPAPPGVAGEICIGGHALATGYWRDARRTALKFPTHPVSGERIYRTGDLGRYRRDGAIEFLGRMGNQLKVRGTRVDPREVEAVLCGAPGVRQALVTALASPDGPGVEAIGAYVVGEEGCEVGTEALRRHAAMHLPAAMRPSTYLQVASLPLTANGKVDRGALLPLNPCRPPEGQGTGSPATAQERMLLAIWRGLLPGASIGREDNFFDMGGNSLLAVRLIARLRQDLGREVPLARWLDKPTISHLASLLGEAVDAGGGRQPRMARDVSELRPCAELDPDLVFSQAPPAGTAWVVTGATGLIGSRLVAYLLEHTEADVICLLKDSQRDAFLRESVARLVSWDATRWKDRLHGIHGDLAEPRFGLNQAAFASVAQQARCVFHVAAQVNLVLPYEALAPANVRGTQEAIRLAASSGAVLCHVSSVGVMPYGKGRVVREDEPLAEEGQLLTGYCQSKWVAEQMVRAAMRRGLRAVVFRPGLTVGSGALPAQRDLLACVLALSRHAGCLPASDLPMDLVDAGYAAAAMAHIGRDPRAVGRTFHLTNPQPRPLHQLLGTLGLALPQLPFDQWKERIAAQAPRLQDNRLSILASLIARQSEEDITPAVIDCTSTQELLRGSGISSITVEDLLARSLQGTV